ncbi:ABC-F family ATP-binding cassette domain-containing protein [Rhodoblastus acidophilus]|uniref:ABC-F family ATP-binding cassette domain-containing protein n=1 Tax=Candidatus Rhodoblastus alkanivorans TaxID=2954117 RepID=A0ABS9Z7Q5_9HYPH|nr:ABC-F family ATP-binding cassette domain-containing protein [Candidatus Rhodoblastus alkanivorans]MCI4678363.1 ABC-F family ATP-binding cassette domain-containing protein [Candidatus Rhodoblastus alkanivorans]MCI4683621.1 ABC-F family ATP-binding cassette domain-containing protein [Candidatus Rhodoblastus alkanivorans]MDI4640937.1 ABC-F family ATP-binding cassette domain-containing protein [Rhodoblastus acidophilus]
MLTVTDLTYRLGPRLLFDAAGLALPERAKVGFVGRNGAGKTTLFRLICGEIAAESGAIQLPRGARIGRVEQEAPGGDGKLIDFVLAADIERSALLEEAETAQDPHRIAEIHIRLADIEAHAAPARAATILSGLGFDEDAQNRALKEFSGGWRMRVALAAVLFSRPDLLLLDEPTNYLDLEGTLWLIDYLGSYPATIVVISHDRDLLNEVCDHIVHLDRAKLQLYRGNYDSFAHQRAEAKMLQAKFLKKQEDRRAHLQAFVDRFRAKATKARQAQSRLKMLEKMESVEAMVDEDVLPFVFPSPEKPLSPPIIAMEKVAVGYGERIVLSGLSLSLANDDRIGLLGANGNGKSTFAKLLGGRLDPMSGTLSKSPKLEAAFFAQHQVDDLNLNDTPFMAVQRLMADAPEAKVRTRAAQIGFPNVKADTRVSHLSGGEKARLLMGLATFNGPHLLILDEPTNHLDIDSRAALAEAINDFSGAVILISHDQYLLEACADRLWLVAEGKVRTFDGDMADYRKFVLDSARNSRKDGAEKKREAPTEGRRDAAKARRDAAPLARKVKAAEEKMTKFSDLVARVDLMLSDPRAFERNPAEATKLSQQRAELQRALTAAEEEWLELSAELEAFAGG